jgi:hypothetical protein
MTVDTMTHADMVAARADGHGKDVPRDYEVTIVNVFRNAATATVNSARFVDYLQIARFADRWRIVNVLYEPLSRR